MQMMTLQEEFREAKVSKEVVVMQMDLREMQTQVSKGTMEKHMLLREMQNSSTRVTETWG